MAKTYRYENHTIRQTDVTCLNNGRKCYEIEGEHRKPAAQWPFLTSIREAREYIDGQVLTYSLPQ